MNTIENFERRPSPVYRAMQIGDEEDPKEEAARGIRRIYGGNMVEVTGADGLRFGRRGDWIVWDLRGRVEVLSDEAFRGLYQPAGASKA